MIRLVAFDLDGTVLNGIGQASEASVETIRALVDAGVAVASISGRNTEKSQAPFAGVPELAAAMYIGSYNGAVVLGPAVDGSRRLLHEQRLSSGVFQEVVDYIGERGLSFVYCRYEVAEGRMQEDYMTDRNTASVQGLVALTGVRFVINGNLLSRIEAGELGPPPKLIVMPGPQRRDVVLEEMQEIFGQRLYLARTGDDRVEAMHPEVNKGRALRTICETCGVSLAQTLAVGDGDNDLPMLREAGVGVLVQSADEQTVRLAADAGLEMAPSLEAEGFSKVVEQYALDGR